MDSRFHCHTKGLVRLTVKTFQSHINKQLLKLISTGQNFCFGIPVQKAISLVKLGCIKSKNSYILLIDDISFKLCLINVVYFL